MHLPLIPANLAEELLNLELGRCDVLLTEAMQTVKAFHPLVSAGRVVSAPMLDNTGQPVRNPEKRRRTDASA